MCGKGGKIVCHVLPVTDIAQDLIVHRNVRRGARYMEARACHGAYERDGLKRNGLSAGVRAGDDNAADTASRLKVEGHARFFIQHGI